MDQYIIWHNSRCSKSRQTLQLLQEQGIEPTARFYLEDTPSKAELQEILKLLQLNPIEITRTSEKLFKELDLNKTDDNQTILAALSNNPKLIERPIVIKNNQQAALGRPPENVLELISSIK